MGKYIEIEIFLINFLKNETKRVGFENVVVGLSGGLDSAIVAVLLKKAFNKNLLAIMMPSSTSSEKSLIDAKALCEKFDINYKIEPIGNLVDNYFKDKKFSSLQKGNFSARVRMSILYDYSTIFNALVIGTSNKSEIALGYGTIYGDLACAINPIGDMYKSDLFEFAKYLGVNERIVNKAPSADLWENQSDEEELGFSYKQIDVVLRDFLDKKKSKDELLSKYDKDLVSMVINRFYQNEFKRKLPIIARRDCE